MVATGRWLAGDTPLGIRFGAAILYVVAGLALFRTASLLYGTKLAIASCWIALAMPLLAVGGIIASPDAPSVLFWNLTVWAVAEFWRSQNPRWWLAVGVFAGCGLLSKYTNLFLGASILIWLTAVPGNAKSLRLPQFWLGGLIAAALFMPVVIWNYHHDWASFAMQFGRVTESSARFGHFEILMIGTYLGLASPVDRESCDSWSGRHGSRCICATQKPRYPFMFHHSAGARLLPYSRSARSRPFQLDGAHLPLPRNIRCTGVGFVRSKAVAAERFSRRDKRWFSFDRRDLCPCAEADVYIARFRYHWAKRGAGARLQPRWTPFGSMNMPHGLLHRPSQRTRNWHLRSARERPSLNSTSQFVM